MSNGNERQNCLEEISAALKLMPGVAERSSAKPRPAATFDLSDVLALARELEARFEASDRPVLRSVHHFACTGGTLICRCIGAMSNTHVLSEVDPLSSKALDTKNFFPTDLISLAKLSARPPLDEEDRVQIFLGGLKALSDLTRRRGVDLVLRDHTHSHFCVGETVPVRPTLRDMLQRDYMVRSLVTVRHPLDSFLSLTKHGPGWIDFSPATLEEYAQRYVAFLDCYKDLEILRYEDFLIDPEAVMQQISTCLDLSYNPDFQNVFSVLPMSGDSGRKGEVIAPRPRRPVSEEMRAEVGRSPAYEALCARLGYNPEPAPDPSD